MSLAEIGLQLEVSPSWILCSDFDHCHAIPGPTGRPGRRRQAAAAATTAAEAAARPRPAPGRCQSGLSQSELQPPRQSHCSQAAGLGPLVLLNL